jgi:glycosyltransferase involved in cell wall biosynthesis
MTQTPSTGGGHDSGRPRGASRRLHIVVSTPTFLPVVGGAELGVHEIYRRIAKYHDVTIVTPHLRVALLKGYAADDYSSEDYRVERLVPWLEQLRPLVVGRALKRTSLPYILHLCQLRRRKPISVVNFHYIAPHGGALIFFRWFLGVPALISMVGRADVVQLLNPVKRRYAKLVLRAASGVLPISDFYLRGDDIPKGAQVVPYGVDVNEFEPGKATGNLRAQLGVGPEAVMLLCVQRLAAVKRVDMLVHVLQQVVKTHPEAVLVIVGQGSEEDAISELVREHHLEANVRMCGYVDSSDLAEYFASADLFVFYSLFETFGIVFAQAMASGLPIVAADTSCVRDVVLPANGQVVRDGDVIAFSEAIGKLIDDPAGRAAISANNRARAEVEFDWDRIATTYERLLEDAAGPQPSVTRSQGNERG